MKKENASKRPQNNQRPTLDLQNSDKKTYDSEALMKQYNLQHFFEVEWYENKLPWVSIRIKAFLKAIRTQI